MSADDAVADDFRATVGAGAGDGARTATGRHDPAGVVVDIWCVVSGCGCGFGVSETNCGGLASAGRDGLVGDAAVVAGVVVGTYVRRTVAGAAGFFLDGLVVHPRWCRTFCGGSDPGARAGSGRGGDDGGRAYRD